MDREPDESEIKRNFSAEEPIYPPDSRPEDISILQQAVLPPIPESGMRAYLANAFQFAEAVSLGPVPVLARPGIYAGEPQGLRETRRILAFLTTLPFDAPLLLDFSRHSATTDFLEPLVQCLLYPGAKTRPFPGRKIVFLNPDPTTLFALARSLESGRTSGLALQTEHFPWTLQLVGHLEPHLLKILEYIRITPGITTQDMVRAELGRTQGNMGGRLKELVDLGLVDRSLVPKTAGIDRRSERLYCYYRYHPLRDLFPLFPFHLLPHVSYQCPRYCLPDIPPEPQENVL